VGLRAGLDRCGKSRLRQDSIPDPHEITCYMKEDNIKIDRNNYCFKLGPDLSG
jgi:hypothetical protein